MIKFEYERVEAPTQIVFKSKGSKDVNAVYEQVWKSLDSCIEKVFQSEQISKQKAFRDVQKLCNMGRSEELANRVTSKLNTLIMTQIDQLQQDFQREQSLTLLKDFWMKFCQEMQIVRDMFLYLERTYLISSQNLENADIPPDVRNLSPVGS